MTDAGRNRILWVFLMASFGLNGALLAYLARIGTFERALVVADLIDRRGDDSEARRKIVEGFRKLPSGPNDVVFAGDSLIEYGPWADFYSDIHNRGIRGDTSAGLLARLDEVIDGHPRLLYLLVGTNDLGDKIPEAQVERNYRATLDRVAAESPGTQVVVVGVLPVNLTFPGPPNYGNDRIASLNRRIGAMVAAFPSYHYIDIGPSLSGPSGELRKDLTIDGVHLNVDGYLIVREALAKLGPDSPAAEPSKPGGPAGP